MTTTKQQLIEERIGAKLPDLVLKMRQDDRSWRWIARKISEQSGVDISHTALRSYIARDAA